MFVDNVSAKNYKTICFLRGVQLIANYSMCAPTGNVCLSRLTELRSECGEQQCSDDGQS